MSSPRIGQHRLVFRSAAPLSVLVVLVAGCAREERVVRYHPMLGGLPGSVSGTADIRGLEGYVDPTAVRVEDLVKVDPATQKKTLIAKSGRHLMVHIYNALRDGDKGTFVSQILSRETKEECAARGVEPGACFDELKRRQDDVLALFNAMPSGEYTPGVLAMPLGGKSQRIELQGLAAQGLSWTGIDMVMEQGNWKLRWFYGPGE